MGKGTNLGSKTLPLLLMIVVVKLESFTVDQKMCKVRYSMIFCDCSIHT